MTKSPAFRQLIQRESLALFLARSSGQKEAEKLMTKLKGDLFEIMPDGKLKAV